MTSVADYEGRTLRDFPSLEEPPPGADRSEQELRHQLEMRYPKR